MRASRSVNHGAVLVLVLAAAWLSGSPANADMLVSSYGSNEILRYDQSTGAFKGVFASGLSNPEGITFGPDGDLYVGNLASGQILRLDGQTGASLGVFAQGILSPTYLAFGPDGNLYVGSGREILRYNGSTGAFMGVFVSTFSPETIRGLAFGDGKLFYGVIDNAAATESTLIVANASTGATLGASTLGFRVFDAMTVGPDGNVYVSSHEPVFPPNFSGIDRYDVATGAFSSLFGDINPDLIGLEFGPDGALYVANFFAVNPSDAAVLRVDPSTGAFSPFVSVGSSGMDAAFDLAFTPQASGVPAPSGLTLASLGALGLFGCRYWRRCRLAAA